MSLYGKAACIWHAYTALEEQSKGGEVLKSQLKVLTHNIASCIAIHDVERRFDEFNPSTSRGDVTPPTSPSAVAVTFDTYLTFLRQHVFSDVREADLRNGNVDLNSIDELCWFVCGPSYVNRLRGGKTTSADVMPTSPSSLESSTPSAIPDRGKSERLLEKNCIFKFWRVFNALAEVDTASSQDDDEPEVVFPVRMDWEEVLVLVQRISRLVGTEFNKESWRRDIEPFRSFMFVDLVRLVEGRCLSGCDDMTISMVVTELYDENILAVMKKGYLNKKGPHMLAWKERWFVLTPTMLTYYTSRDEKEKKGEFAITDKTTVEEVNDKFVQKQNRFIIHAGSRDYELSAVDIHTKHEWITTLRTAVKLQSSSKAALTKEEIRQRRISRFARREKITQDEMQRKQDQEEKLRTLQLLEDEKQKRAAIEAKMQEDDRMRQEERERLEMELENAKRACINAMAKYREKDEEYEQERLRLLELEEMQRNLEILLERERQALAEERRTRELQERALLEEQESKRKLEAMQRSLEKLLLDEQQKYGDLEETKRQQEELLAEEKRLLIELENERVLRHKEYEEALARLQEAEKEKDDMRALLERKKVLKKFSGDEPIFMPSSHRGVDPGTLEGLRSQQPAA